MMTPPAGLLDKFSNTSKNNTMLSSPSLHTHTIKYVIPAEQPLEKIEQQQKMKQTQKTQQHQQVHKSLFQKPKETIDLLQTNDEVLARPLLPIRTNKGIKTDIDETIAPKSWAEVLGEELNASENNSKITTKVDKYHDDQKKHESNPLASSVVIHKDETLSSQLDTQKPKKKRNSKRISILEQIYGDAIRFRDDDSPTTTKSSSTTLPSIAITAPSFTDSNTSSSSFANGYWDALNSRPVPSLDEKLIGDLMSFHHSDSEDDLLEDHSYFQNVNDVDEKIQSPVSLAPFQSSTMLATPPPHGLPGQSDIVLVELTPVTDDPTASINDSTITGDRSRILEAPCKKLTKARTPYKQEMLDILERTLAAAREKKNNEENNTLDCTIWTDTSTLVPCDDQTVSETGDAKNSGTDKLMISTIDQKKENDTNQIVFH